MTKPKTWGDLAKLSQTDRKALDQELLKLAEEALKPKPKLKLVK